MYVDSDTDESVPAVVEPGASFQDIVDPVLQIQVIRADYELVVSVSAAVLVVEGAGKELGKRLDEEVPLSESVSAAEFLEPAEVQEQEHRLVSALAYLAVPCLGELDEIAHGREARQIVEIGVGLG